MRQGRIFQPHIKLDAWTWKRGPAAATIACAAAGKAAFAAIFVLEVAAASGQSDVPAAVRSQL